MEREREVQILRSDNGEKWYEHPMIATEDAVNEAMRGTMEDGEPVSSMLSEFGFSCVPFNYNMSLGGRKPDFCMRTTKALIRLSQLRVN